MADVEELSDRDREVLEFARLHWRYFGAKETAIFERWGWTHTRYSQVLDHLLDQPAALRQDPQLVRRLIRVRDERRAARSART